MIAANDPLVRILAAFEGRNDIIDRFQAPIRGEAKTDFCRAGSEVVGDRESAPPTGWGHGSFQGGEQGLGVRIGDRKHGDLEHRCGIRDGQAHRVLCGPDLGRKRIAGIEGHIHHGSALHTFGRAVPSFGINIARRITIIAWVRIDETTDGAMFGSQLGFEAPPTATVTHDDNLILHADAAPREFLVIVRHALIHISQLGNHVSVRAIDVVGRQRVAGLDRCAVSVHRRFPEAGFERDGRNHFQGHFHRRGIENLKGLDVRVPSPFTELFENKFRVFLVVGRSDMVGSRCESFQPRPLVFGVQLGIEFYFDGKLFSRRSGREAEHILWLFCGAPGQDHRADQAGQQAAREFVNAGYNTVHRFHFPWFVSVRPKDASCVGAGRPISFRRMEANPAHLAGARPRRGSVEPFECPSAAAQSAGQNKITDIVG